MQVSCSSKTEQTNDINYQKTLENAKLFTMPIQINGYTDHSENRETNEGNV